MKKQISAGGIVYRRTGKKIYILMITDPSNKSAFPKGLIDSGETPETAALREVKEETGLHDLEIIEPLGAIKFFYTWKNEKILKSVHFFLMKTDEKKFTPQLDEIKSAQWVELEKVLEKSGYKNQKPLIKKAVKAIRKLAKKRL
ncbi:MAG: NUDIX domain-containing protein [Candidatus Aenigmarchaeota archaeon]|nr:NUDIX domain-containing protein [Candidatus Aenigmarchaeota archaeon]